MDPLTLAAISGGVNLLGSLFASSQSAKANNAAQRHLDRRISNVQGLFDQEQYGNSFNRADTQSALTRSRDGLRDIMKSTANNAVRTGATAEAQAAMKGQAGRSYSDLLGNILQAGQQRKDMMTSRYQQMLSGLEGQKYNYMLQDAQKWPQLMQNIAGFSGNLADVLSMPGSPGPKKVPTAAGIIK